MRVRAELRTVNVQKSENVREHSDFQIKSGECPKVRRMSENTPIFR
jgi:hypothetical protein